MLGLKRGTVKLLKSSHKEWARLFEKEKKLLTTAFGNRIISIEHVGSTAIPGIPAKPILDMNIGVHFLKVARSMKKKFAKIGYEHRPFVPGKTKKDLAWQELYVKGPEAKRTHHAHVTVFNNDYWKNDLLFRDYLRNHESARNRYATLKIKLAKKHSNDRKTYTAKKERFILNIVLQAKKRRSRSTSK